MLEKERMRRNRASSTSPSSRPPPFSGVTPSTMLAEDDKGSGSAEEDGVVDGDTIKVRQ